MREGSRVASWRSRLQVLHSGGPRPGLLVIGLVLAGCGGGADAPGESPGAEPVPTAGTTSAEIPVSEPTGPPDAARADRGQQVFSARGCVACHHVGRGQRLVGPDLAGVHERRSFAWFYHMIMSPDSMTRNDETARAMLLEYMTPMPYQGVQPEEVPALWDYFRRAAESQPAP